MTNTNDGTIGIPLEISIQRLVSIIETARPSAQWFKGVTINTRLGLAEAIETGCSTAVVVTGGAYDVAPKHRISRTRLATALGELLSQGSYAACQFMMGKEDAATADVILQQAVFGKVVYA